MQMRNGFDRLGTDDITQQATGRSWLAFDLFLVANHGGILERELPVQGFGAGEGTYRQTHTHGWLRD